jgi:acetyl-CoA acetyltransferase family protein
MTDAVIVSTARTPIGTAGRGTLVDVDALELGTLVVSEAVRRAGVDPALVDDVVLGESLYGGGDIARYAALEAGMPHAPGVAHNRHCASGLAAVQTAASSIMAGMDRLVVAGGAQSSSTMPRGKRRVPGTDDWEDWFSPTHPDSPQAPNMDMSITVGWNAAVKANVTREQMDAWALRSHQRAVASIDDGRFEDEIVPVEVTRRDGTTTTFAVDEHPRRDTSMEKLASLKVLHPEIEGFSITAGNAAGANDGAAAMVIASGDLADELGLAPMAFVRGRSRHPRRADGPVRPGQAGPVGGGLRTAGLAGGGRRPRRPSPAAGRGGRGDRRPAAGRPELLVDDRGAGADGHRVRPRRPRRPRWCRACSGATRCGARASPSPTPAATSPRWRAGPPRSTAAGR